MKVKVNRHYGYGGYGNRCFKFYVVTFKNIRNKYQDQRNQTDERQHKDSKECFIYDPNILGIYVAV